MANGPWFYAEGDKQLGPYSEAELRDFIVRGNITATTFVWTEGMSGWQRAGDIPGLISSAASPPRPPGPPGVGVASAAVASSGTGYAGRLAVDVGIWELLGRWILFVIGFLLVIPAPWVAVGLYRWFVSRLRVPGRPNLAFTGQVGDIWYVFILLALCTYANAAPEWYVPYVLIPFQAWLSWMTLKWAMANISSDGQRLPLSFTGDAWGYIGWYVLFYLSLITIIGWAWVTTAMMRWICRNIAGTRRAVVFEASGWEVLWRTVVFVIACAFVIPIPWVLGWYTRWYASQFALVERTV